MSTIKPAGIWNCTVISAKARKINEVGVAQITVRIDEGPAAGVQCTYEDELIGKSVPFTARSMKSVGWAGVSARTLEADAAAWIAKTGGKTTVEIKHLEIKRGKNAGGIWDKPTAIGKTTERASAPLDGSALDDADEALRRALGDDAPPPSDEDSPF